MYWHSRLIAELTDADRGNALLFDERYVNAVMNRGQQFLYEYDEKIHQGDPLLTSLTVRQRFACAVGNLESQTIS